MKSNSITELVKGTYNDTQHQGLYSLSGKTSYRKISWSLEAARFGISLFQSLWNLAGTSAALLPRCLSNFRAIRPLQHPISRLRDFTRFGGKTSYRLVNRGPEQRTPKKVLWTVLGCSWPMHTLTWYLDPYDDIEIPELNYWNMHLKQSRKEYSIISSNIPAWPHQLLVCTCFLERAYFNYLDNKFSIWTRTKVVRRKHIIQPTGFGAYSLACF